MSTIKLINLIDDGISKTRENLKKIEEVLKMDIDSHSEELISIALRTNRICLANLIISIQNTSIKIKQETISYLSLDRVFKQKDLADINFSKEDNIRAEEGIEELKCLLMDLTIQFETKKLSLLGSEIENMFSKLNLQK